MAWGDLTNSQMVSYVEASTSPFSLVPGQSHFTTTPAANQCMTKANALGRYVLNSSYMSSYADNQLVPKSTWIPGVSYPYTFYAQDATSSSGSCAVSGSTFTLYSADTPLAVYSRLYTDINLTNTFYAGEIEGDWFKGTDNRTYRMQNYWDPNSTYDPKIAEIVSCIPGFDGEVHDIKIQSDGKILVGGNFSTYKGNSDMPFGLVRLLPDGTLDTTFNPSGLGAYGTVYSIAILPDGRIAIGGQFDIYNNVVVNHVAILNPEGTLNLTLTGTNGAVYAVAYRGPYLFIGGHFTSLNGSPAGNIGAIHVDTGVKNPSFNIGSGFNELVFAIHIGTDNEIYVGGLFTTYKSSTAKALVKLQDNGTLLRNYNLSAQTSYLYPFVTTITTTPEYRLLAGGVFKQPSGTVYNNIVAFNADGTVYNVFGTGITSRVNKITVLQNNDLLVSGDFSSYNGQTTKTAIKLFFGLQVYNLNINYTPDFNGYVNTQAVDSSNNAYYGGVFTLAADTTTTKTVNRIAKFSNTGTLLSI